MLNKIKKLLGRCLTILAFLLLFVAGLVYIWVNSVLVTLVVNELRLDTYIGLETGFGIVLLIFFVGWAPAWFLAQYMRR